ncbi:hypothetical protein F383_22575 [Gossypium arboreum]|uniref:Uncharacterized protein n=1 Tax=Gossypium arboreum TaxID=29729 RepID=A0A0B0P1N1_GOSAR|nr:hypothetical protein F383_22575 [Gossypium arboreum]
MIFGEKNKCNENRILLNNMKRNKAKLFGRGSVYRKDDEICVTPSPIYSTRKPSLFLLKF